MAAKRALRARLAPRFRTCAPETQLIRIDEMGSSSANIGGMGGRSFIYVHGRDYKPAAEDLFDLVIAALAAGIERDCIERLVSASAACKRTISRVYLLPRPK